MKSFLAWAVLFTAIAAAAAGTSCAVAEENQGGNNKAKLYNAATERTVKGTVLTVNQRAANARVILKTREGTLDVRMGPSGFLARNHFTINPGDQIEVTGSEMTRGVTRTLVAQEVKKGNVTLDLRNANGMPLWPGGRQSSIGPGQTGGSPGMSRGMGMGQRMGMGMGQGMGMGMGAQEQNVTAGSSGEGIFAADCAACHNANSTVRKVGPGLKKLYERPALSNGEKVTDENIRAFLRQSHNGMPSFTNTLSQEQVDRLIAYLKTL